MAPERMVPLALSGVAFVASSVRMALALSDLPDQVSSHFDLAGRPDGVQAKGAFVATSIGLQLLVLVFLTALPWLVGKLPARLVNLPHRDYWLAPARREESLARLAALSDWFTAATLALMATTGELAVRANLRSAPLDVAGLVIVLFAYVAFAVTFGVRMWRAFPAPPSEHP